jgi:hypothetical protein
MLCVVLAKVPDLPQPAERIPDERGSRCTRGCGCYHGQRRGDRCSLSGVVSSSGYIVLCVEDTELMKRMI